MKEYNQYRDIEFCDKYKGCCGTCLTRDEHNNICQSTDGEFSDLYTENSCTCASYIPCELAHKMLEREQEEMIEKFERTFW